MRKIILASAISLILLISHSQFSFAQGFIDVECDADGNAGVNTAIGCIPYADKDAFVIFVLKWAMGISGGIALLLIIVGGFQIMTAGGDPKKLQAGKELLTSTIAGLVFIVFATLILEIIGVDILGI